MSAMRWKRLKITSTGLQGADFSRPKFRKNTIEKTTISQQYLSENSKFEHTEGPCSFILGLQEERVRVEAQVNVVGYQ